MSKRKPSDIYKCGSCGKPWDKHAGCEQLCIDNKRLREQLAEAILAAKTGNMVIDAQNATINRLQEIVDKLPVMADGKTRAHVGMNCCFFRKQKMIEAGILSLGVDEERDHTPICRVRSSEGREYVVDVADVLPEAAARPTSASPPPPIP